MQKIMCVVIFICLFCKVYAQTVNDSERLISDLMANYNKIVRPAPDQTNAVQVNFSYSLYSIEEFDEVKGKLTMSVVLYLTWIDARLIWKPELYNNSYSVILPIDWVWKPELLLINSADLVKPLARDWMLLRYSSNGKAKYWPGGIFDITCSVNIMYYPFDTQQCFLMFVPHMYSSSEVLLTFIEMENSGPLYTENNEWVLIRNDSYSFNQFDVSFMQLRVVLARRPTFIVVNVLLPIVIISFLNIFVFFLPIDSGERMSYAVTMLLSMAVYMTIIGDNIPKTSRPVPLLCYFIGSHVLLSALICWANVFSIRIFHKSCEKQLPSWLKWFVRNRHPDASLSPSLTIISSRDSNESPNKTKEGGSKTDNLFRILTTENYSPKLTPTSSTDTDQASWKIVSSTVDKIFIVLSLIFFAVSCTTFLFLILSNDNVVKDYAN